MATQDVIDLLDSLNVSTLPPAPQRSDPPNFAKKSDDFFLHMEVSFAPEVSGIKDAMSQALAAIRAEAVSAAGAAQAAINAADQADRAEQEADRAAASTANLPAGTINDAVQGASTTYSSDKIEQLFESVESIYLEWSSTNIYITQTVTAKITNYDSLTDYTASATLGTATISGDTITYTAPSTAGTEKITVNGRVVSFEILPAGIMQPSITGPTNGAIDLGSSVNLIASAFNVIPDGYDTHATADWQVATDAGFTNIVFESLADSANLESITATGLTESTLYYVRVRFNGSSYNSDWSPVSQFTTSNIFPGLIGTAGGQGFGVGIYPDESDSAFTALGLTGMTGYQDPASDNYGNYQHTNGSIMVFVPKFYFRVGNAGATHYATYGANTLEIAGIDQFSDAVSANTAGYTLYPAFIDGGSEKHGVFVDKYLLSKDGSNAVSVKNGNPIGLTTNASYNPSNGFISGCTGMLADALLLCRDRGTGYNQTSAFIYSALAMLADAHGQHATTATYCAWYDATLTINYPKGCNSSLADVDDPTVTFTASPDNASKPLTGSASNLAKTAHNGQNCGIIDLNGAMFEPALGISNYGASATATTAISNDQIYVLKESVALADLTAGWNTGNDACGDASHMATLYDQVTTSHALGSTTGVVYWGNGSNAVYDANARTVGFIPKDNNSTNATGANQFGTDYFNRYNRQNLFPLVGGDWSYSSNAGLFARYFRTYRSFDSSGAGARASAYAS